MWPASFPLLVPYFLHHEKMSPFKVWKAKLKYSLLKVLLVRCHVTAMTQNDTATNKRCSLPPSYFPFMIRACKPYRLILPPFSSKQIVSSSGREFKICNVELRKMRKLPEKGMSFNLEEISAGPRDWANGLKWEQRWWWDWCIEMQMWSLKCTLPLNQFCFL